MIQSKLLEKEKANLNREYETIKSSILKNFKELYETPGLLKLRLDTIKNIGEKIGKLQK